MGTPVLFEPHVHLWSPLPIRLTCMLVSFSLRLSILPFHRYIISALLLFGCLVSIFFLGHYVHNYV
ncbi:hypothetical protein V1519DRAFT_447311, partial [Lipomyces tetrasporus]